MEFYTRFVSAIQHFVGRLNLAQRLYFLAFAYLIFTVLFLNTDDQVMFVGLIALCALFIDMWPRFVKVWESLLGRVCLISVYVIIGNLAVAAASHKLSHVTGIDPSPLFYAKGFVTLLMAPIWLLSVTLFFMLVYLVVIQTALLFRLLLKVLRFKTRRAENGIAYPTRTALLKFVLIPIMFVPVISGIEAYGQLFGDVDMQIYQAKQPNFISGSGDSNQDALIVVDTTDPEATSEPASESDMDIQFNVDYLIAAFVFNIEAFPYSQCQKAENERALFIGESDVLIVKRNEDAENGFDFAVKECVLASLVEPTVEEQKKEP